MSWFKANLFLGTYGILVAGGVLVLGCLLYLSHSNYVSIRGEYDTQIARLQALRNRSPFPSEDNLEAYKRATAEYRAEFRKFAAQLKSMQLPVENISPQAFQDRLQAVVTEVSKRAAGIGTQLPKDFYMGFEHYKDQLPTQSAAALLAGELAALRLIVDSLLQNRVKAITTIRRELLPEEGASADQSRPAGQEAAEPAVPVLSPHPAPSSNNRRDFSSNKDARVLRSFAFRIDFEAEQGRARQALNAIANAKLFFIIRTLHIENSVLEGPRRDILPADRQPASTDASDLLSQGTGSPRQALTLIVGRESLKVTSKIELITFSFSGSTPH